MDNIQKKISRIRSPRVQITYDLETENGKILKKLPYIITILGDLIGDSKNLVPYRNRRFIDINSGNLNNIMEYLKVNLKLVLPLYLGEKDSNKLVDIAFTSINSFHPDSLIEKIDFLQILKTKILLLKDLKRKISINNVSLNKLLSAISHNNFFSDNKNDASIVNKDKNEHSTNQPNTKSKDEKNHHEKSNGKLQSTNLKDFLYESELVQIPEQEDYATEIITNFFKYLGDDKSKIKNSVDLFKFIDNSINQSQEEIVFYLNYILHSPKFQKLEGTWRSINDLVRNSEISPQLKIKLMHITTEEITDDIEKAPDFDQSFLFKKFYEDNYGTPGGEPIGCVIFDYQFTKSAVDIKLAADLANIFSAAHIQLISSVHPSLFDIKDFSHLNEPIDLKSIFESPELINWNSLRNKEESRYLAIVLPRILKRLPYDTVNNPIKSIVYQEEIDPNNIEYFCWGNAAYAMGQCICRSFANYEWLAAIRGVENGGKLNNMPIYYYRTASGEELTLCPTEVAITDRREKELSDLGFLSLCYFKQSDYSVFFSSQTVIKPQIYDNSHATGNSLISSSLPFMLNVSRFAHYMKCMIRDCIGSHMEKDDIQRYLQNWIANYVTLNDNTDNEIRVRYPLKAASVIVEERPGETGNYYAIVRMIPHFQLESINISTRLVVNLPAKMS